MASTQNSIQAGISNGALVVSFLSADQPRIWRAELSRFNDATLEVQGSKLVLKRGDAAEEVGSFASKEEAVTALQAVTDALLGGTGASATTCSTKKKCGWLKKLFKAVLVLAALFIALLVTLSLLHTAPSSSAGGNAPAANVQSGVPLPADTVFGK